MRIPGQMLLEQVVEEADREGLEPARLVFREAGVVAAESLPQPHFVTAMRSVAVRCKAGRGGERQASEYVKFVTELVFRMATEDGENVSQPRLAAVFVDVRRGWLRRELGERLRVERPAAAATAEGRWAASAGEDGSCRSLRGVSAGSQAWVLNDADAVASFCRKAGLPANREHEWRRSAGQLVDVLCVDAASSTAWCRRASGMELQLALAGLQASAGGDADEGADYAVFRPLAEDIRKHGMSVRKAFDVLREGRPGITEQGLRAIMDCYVAQEPPEARRRACARAWALARMDENLEIGYAEFERLVARGRATAVHSSGGGGAAGPPAVAAPATSSGSLASPGGEPSGSAVAVDSAGSELYVGQVVSAYALVQGRKSQRPGAARVEGLARDSLEVVFLLNGARQRIPLEWAVSGGREATAPPPADEAESSEALSAPSSAAESVSNAEPRDQAMSWAVRAVGSRCPAPGSGGAALAGIENIGNSCYMNSILQCLAGSVDIAHYFLGCKGLERDLNADNWLGSGGHVAREFASLLGSLWNGTEEGFVRPTKFKTAVAKAAEQFGGNEQQDAQEFAAWLLDVLHEDLNRVRGRKPAVEFPNLTREVLTPEAEERAAAECWSLCLKRDKSIIVDTFQGQLRSQIRCLRCSFLSTKFDSFMYLSLPVVDAAGAPLHGIGECLREFSREERLSGEERWYCPRCRDRVEAMKALALWKLPPVLLIHLKRFSFRNGSPGGGTGGNSGWHSGGQPFRSPWTLGAQKLSHKVDVALEGLDLGAVGALPPGSPQKSEPIFDLFAMVDHFGSCGYGHYTAIVWHEALARWYRFDDESVAPLEAHEARSDRAYLLFFRRRGDVVRPQTRSAPEAWPHCVNGSWSFLRSETKDGGRVYL